MCSFVFASLLAYATVALEIQLTGTGNNEKKISMAEASQNAREAEYPTQGGVATINGHEIVETVANYVGAHGAIDNHLDISHQGRQDCLNTKVAGLSPLEDGASCHAKGLTRSQCAGFYELKYRGNHRVGFGEPGVSGSTGPASGNRLDKDAAGNPTHGNREYAASFDLVGETHRCEWVGGEDGSCEAGRQVTVCPEDRHAVQTARNGEGRNLAHISRNGQGASSNDVPPGSTCAQQTLVFYGFRYYYYYEFTASPTGLSYRHMDPSRDAAARQNANTGGFRSDAEVEYTTLSSDATVGTNTYHIGIPQECYDTATSPGGRGMLRADGNCVRAKYNTPALTTGDCEPGAGLPPNSSCWSYVSYDTVTYSISGTDRLGFPGVNSNARGFPQWVQPTKNPISQPADSIQVEYRCKNYNKPRVDFTNRGNDPNGNPFPDITWVPPQWGFVAYPAEYGDCSSPDMNELTNSCASPGLAYWYGSYNSRYEYAASGYGDGHYAEEMPVLGCTYAGCTDSTQARGTPGFRKITVDHPCACADYTPPSDPCTPNPCMNGGTCAVAHNRQDHVCTCADGFNGDSCESKILTGACASQDVVFYAKHYYYQFTAKTQDGELVLVFDAPNPWSMSQEKTIAKAGVVEPIRNEYTFGIATPKPVSYETVTYEGDGMQWGMDSWGSDSTSHSMRSQGERSLSIQLEYRCNTYKKAYAEIMPYGQEPTGLAISQDSDWGFIGTPAELGDGSEHEDYWDASIAPLPLAEWRTTRRYPLSDDEVMMMSVSEKLIMSSVKHDDLLARSTRFIKATVDHPCACTS